MMTTMTTEIAISGDGGRKRSRVKGIGQVILMKHIQQSNVKRGYWGDVRCSRAVWGTVNASTLRRYCVIHIPYLRRGREGTRGRIRPIDAVKIEEESILVEEAF